VLKVSAYIVDISVEGEGHIGNNVSALFLSTTSEVDCSRLGVGASCA
jgi:hypothetical protein